jgi:hypothetical protein
MSIYHYKPVKLLVLSGYEILRRCKFVATLFFLSFLVTACSGELDFLQEAASELTGSTDSELLASCSSTLQQATSASSQSALGPSKGHAQDTTSVVSAKVPASGPPSSPKTSRLSP